MAIFDSREVIQWVNGNGRKSLSQGDQKGGRSKHPLILISDDIIDATDVIPLPKTYMKRCKTINLHTK